MFAMVGGASAVDADVIPYGLVAETELRCAGSIWWGSGARGETLSIGQIKFLIAAQRYLFTVVNDFGTKQSHCAKEIEFGSMHFCAAPA